jgi:hypothetical protein
MNDGMTDEQFLGYVELHSTTERHLFGKHHVVRLLELAGRKVPAGIGALVGIDQETAQPLVDAARVRMRRAQIRLVHG